MVLQKLVSELLPEKLDVDPPTIRGDDPIIFTGALLRSSEVHMLQGDGIPRPRVTGDEGIPLRPVFGSHGILGSVAASEPSDYYKTLWSKSGQIPTWVASAPFDSDIERLLRGYKATGFGGGVVSRGTSEAVVTLADLVGLVAKGKISTGSTPEAVASTPVTIDGGAPIVEAIRMMFAKKVRRLFVEGEEGKFVSDRTIVEFMFRPERLEVARDHPESWIDEEVSAVDLKSPTPCPAGDLDEAAKVIGLSPDDCLVTGQGKVVSRWDIMMKPWELGRLAPAGPRSP